MVQYASCLESGCWTRWGCMAFKKCHPWSEGEAVMRADSFVKMRRFRLNLSFLAFHWRTESLHNSFSKPLLICFLKYFDQLMDLNLSACYLYPYNTVTSLNYSHPNLTNWHIASILHNLIEINFRKRIKWLFSIMDNETHHYDFSQEANTCHKIWKRKSKRLSHYT